MRYLLKFSYKGTNYKGMQAQKGEKTIQGALESIIKMILREDIKISVAGRTDAKVHAIEQFAHFDFEKEVDSFRFLYNVNSLLRSEDIAVLDINLVENDFHARYSCKMKTYKYQFILGNKKNVFLKDQYWQIKVFDMQKANECAKLILGTHDFSSFRDKDCQAKSPIKTIEECYFFEENGIIIMKIKAKSFLHRQVRIIVGTIYEIIKKEEPVEKILEILEKKDRKYAYMSAPADGLFLEKIEY